MTKKITPTSSVSQQIRRALHRSDPVAALSGLIESLSLQDDVDEAITYARYIHARASTPSDVRHKLLVVIETMEELRRRQVDKAKQEGATMIRLVTGLTGLSLTEIADVLKVSRRTVAYWHSGEQMMSAENRQGITSLVSIFQRCEKQLRQCFPSPKTIVFTRDTYFVNGLNIRFVTGLHDAPVSLLSTLVARIALAETSISEKSLCATVE